MTSVAPLYPQVETPTGWTRVIKGPRIWLTPPTPGGRIVVAPLQARPNGLPPQRFLEMIFKLERDSVRRLKQTKPQPFTSAQHLPGLIVDLAALDERNQPIEWRCYALFATPKLFGLMFAQSHPSRHDELRRVFLAVVKTTVLPETGAAAAPPPLELWGEL